jgi:hypothetical protein
MTNQLPIYGFSVCHGVATTVDEAVDRLIMSLMANQKDGWVAQGSITYLQIHDTHIFSQTIVRLIEVTA